MELTNLPMFGLLRSRMNWLGQRQEVLAQNVANADTPNYSSHDLKAFDFRQVVNDSGRDQPSVALRRTNVAHIQDGSAGGRGNFVSGEVRDPYETAPDGNAVVIEEQMVKMNETVTNHNLITQIYKKQMLMFKAVTRRGS